MSSPRARYWPVIREYERTTTAILNGYVHPRVAAYLKSLEAALRRRSVPARAMITKSNGGIMNVAAGKRACVDAALGHGLRRNGCVPTSREAPASTMSLTSDIGGTSADLALIIDRRTAIRDGRADRRVPALRSQRFGNLDRQWWWLDRLGG